MSEPQPEPATPSYRVQIAPTADGNGRRGPPDLSPREARDRWIDKLRVDQRDSTVSTYHYRIKHFVEWCETEGITSISDVTGWDLEEYELHRRDNVDKPVSLNKELGTLQNFFEYCARIELVDEGLPEKVEKPDIDQHDEVNEEILETDAARKLLTAFDADPEIRHSRAHALLTVTWYVGCRLGGLRALDVNYYNPEERTLEFVHRPDKNLPLKNGRDGERVVGLQQKVCDVLDGYLEENRHDVYDDVGLRPLFASAKGRPTQNTVRNWMYMATFPCIHSPCPHGNDAETCEYIDFNKASQCPSSRSPHPVRSGSITWQRNQGVPIEVVAKRVNSSPRTIEKHYDKPDPRKEMEERRRPFVDDLSLDSDNGTEGGGGE